MSFFSRLFEKTRGKARETLDDLPPVYGGDGSTPNNAVVINCASTGMANHLIDDFLSKKHGRKDADWKRTIEFFVNGEDIPFDTIRAVGIETRDGKTLTYNFDIGRSVRNLDHMAGLMGILPKLDKK